LRSYLFRGRNAEWLNVNFQEIRKLVDDQAPLEFTGLDAVKP
jgi:hypothetical protein